MMRQPRVLVIGGGSIGERHVRCFLQTGRAQVALCEIDSAVREQVARRYGLNETFADFEQAAAAFDAAVICTPAPWHVPMAIRLVEAGTAVLIEKPLSTGLQDVDRLMRLVEQREVAAAVAYVYRAHPALAEMRDAIRSGCVGRPVQLVAVAGQHFPFYRPAYREIYYADRATGGGAVQDALTHVINAAQWLVGPVTRLVADADHLVLEGVQVEDTVHVLARHGSLLASYSLNQHQPPNELTITVIGDRGAARFEMHGHCWLSAFQPGDSWREEARFDIQRDDLFVRQANGFLDLLQGRTEPACSLREAVQTLQANLAILAAVEDGTWHSLPTSGPSSPDSDRVVDSI